MSGQAHVAQASDRKPVGRPAGVTDEDLRRVIERLHREGKVVTTTTVQAQVGGARKTIERLMAEIGGIDSSINTKSPTPMAIDKAWQQSLVEHSLAIRTECQLKIDKLRDLLQQTFDALIGVEANYNAADADRVEARSERDELRGKLAIERDARTRFEAELAMIREQAEAASKAEAVMATKLEATLLAVQTFEVQAIEQQREQTRQQDEIVRVQVDSRAAALQAEEYRQDLLRLEAEREAESRAKDHHLDKLYAILEYLAERDLTARAALDMLEGESLKDNQTSSPVSKLLGALKPKMTARSHQTDEPDPPDEEIPF